jgi:hypothetical protein
LKLAWLQRKQSEEPENRTGSPEARKLFNPRKHHDGLEFPDGQIVLLTHVLEGQEATVLQLPAQPATAAEAKAHERVAYIG